MRLFARYWGHTEGHLLSLDQNLIASLQVAGMEYHEDIVNEGITITTGPRCGSNLLKQLAGILGIPLSLETQEQAEAIKRLAKELASEDKDGKEDRSKTLADKFRIVGSRRFFVMSDHTW